MPGHGPRIGKLSGAHGRKPAHVRLMGNAARPGTSAIAAVRRPATPPAVTERWNPTFSTVAPIRSSPDTRGITYTSGAWMACVRIGGT